MLRRRSFKPAKCKTALKLAVSRIKLLKNKREAHLKQLRSELAQLLQSGHDHTAAIRVEHVVREEKTMAAYDFIEIYCEVIAARLLMIESHKKCPTDMKEAISSVIFASPRCSDIPELIDVQKHIMAKYGKEFVASAVELRPDCGVNHLLVEKLSAKAPDGPTKIKILTSIAEEHGVKWQPKQFGENDAQSSQDLVAGPNTFEKATYVETPQVHVPPVQYEKGPPNLHAFYQLKEIDIPTNSNDHSASVATRKSGGDHSKTSGGSNPEIRSSVYTGDQRFPTGSRHFQRAKECHCKPPSIVAIDPDRKAYEIGLPFIKVAGVEHKIDIIECPALPVLDKLLEDPSNEGTFDFAFIDADKNNYWNYHERLLKLVKIGGLMIYISPLWGGIVAWTEEDVPAPKRVFRQTALAFNKAISKDPRIEASVASVGNGFTICRRALSSSFSHVVI